MNFPTKQNTNHLDDMPFNDIPMHESVGYV